MEINKDTTICFAGHHADKLPNGYDDYRSLQAALNFAVCRACSLGYNTFLCRLAKGFDMMAAEAVQSAKKAYPYIQMIGIIPFPCYPLDASEYDTMHFDYRAWQCDDKIVIDNKRCPDSFRKQSDFLLDHAAILVCFHTGIEGETNYLFKKAHEINMLCINLAADRGENATPFKQLASDALDVSDYPLFSQDKKLFKYWFAKMNPQTTTVQIEFDYLERLFQSDYSNTNKPERTIKALFNAAIGFYEVKAHTRIKCQQKEVLYTTFHSILLMTYLAKKQNRSDQMPIKLFDFANYDDITKLIQF